MCAWKEGSLEIILVSYLIQVQISVGMLEMQISVHIGRMEGDNPDFCGYVSTDMLFHIYFPSPPFYELFVVVCHRVFFCCKLLPCTSFLNFALKGHHLL